MYNLGLLTQGGKDVIVSKIQNCTAKEQAKLAAIIKKIEEDGISALDVMNTRPIQPPFLFEIKKGNWRLFYTIKNEVVVIVQCTYKQKQKTELNDRKTAVKRAKYVQKNGFEKVRLY